MKKQHRRSVPIWKRPELTAYIALFIVSLVLLIFIGATERPSHMSARRKAGTTNLTDYTMVRVEDETAPQGYYDQYTMRITRAFKGEIYLAYRMVHEYTQVFVNGEIIYAIDRPNRNVFGKTVGNCWAMVPLFSSDYGRTIVVRIYPVYKGVDYIPDAFIVGERSEIMTQEVVRAIPSMVSSFLAVIIGVVYIIAARSRLISKKATGVELRCLGVFALLLGIWRLTDMRVATLLLPNSAVLMSYATLLSLLLLPVPILLYLWSRLRLSRKAMYLMCTGFLILDSVIVIEQLLNIRDIRENLLLIHGTDAAALGITLICTIWAVRKEGHRMTVNFNPAIVLVVSAGIVIDLFQYYFSDRDPNTVFTVMAVDIYVIVSGFYYLLKMRRDASIDAATGIFNKNRCQEVLQAPGPAPKGTMFIMCDLNGLKEVNDHLGHEAGDRIIAVFSRAMRETFARDTDFVGRFGGDEFIAILENVRTPEEARGQIARLEANVEKAHEEIPAIPLSFSTGYSLAADNPGENLEYLLRRADMEMYLKKKAWHDAHPQVTRRGDSAAAG